MSKVALETNFTNNELSDLAQMLTKMGAETGFTDEDLKNLIREMKEMRFMEKAGNSEAAEQINLTPCDVCLFNPPSSADGKPCGYCPATGKNVE